MSLTIAARRGVAVAAGLAAVAATGLASAQAAQRPAAPAALHVSGHVKIGTGGAFFADPITEAPNGTVFYAAGKKIWVVSGLSKPKLGLIANGHVVALAANSSELFVEVGKTVTEYKRSNGHAGRSWHLSSPEPVTMGGLFAVGSTVWSWTDWATDESGAEPATISSFTTAANAVRTISTNGMTGMLAAGSDGAYFLTPTRLRHARAGGSVQSVSYPAAHKFGDTMAVAGGRIQILAMHFPADKQFLDSYTASALSRPRSHRVSASDFSIAGTGLGLLAVSCQTSSCSTAKIVRLSTGTGAVTASVSLPGAVQLVGGPSGVAITHVGSHFFLVRLT